ncbi:uncharacterized protein LOC127850767 [Dreissena polymorpha]|uniref:RNA-binding protein 48 n=1 Tax=Dreissena polymorpha TaxID=45954 RepID=A0A9D4DBT2_DREPO|nr:uncharacterized protein LOC127850767 [Dreissena polymorpha]KAH3741779.1 hypothetical protein DPMN_048506 [Dreissena polymorpha]
MNRPKHHVRQSICGTRAPYREGRKPTAVKVYTVHHESKYVLVQGVPAVGAGQELVRLFEAQGEIEEHRILDNYPAEHFTETHFIKYKKIQSARFAKKKLDDWSFYGGVLHVCYVPEYETLQETREKLQERHRAIVYRTKKYERDGTYELYQLSSGATKEGTSSASNQENSTLYEVHTESVNGGGYKIPIEDNTQSLDKPEYMTSPSHYENFQRDERFYTSSSDINITPNDNIANREFSGGSLSDITGRNLQLMSTSHTMGSAKQGTLRRVSKPQSEAVLQAQAMQLYGSFDRKSNVPPESDNSPEEVSEQSQNDVDLFKNGSHDQSVVMGTDSSVRASAHKRPHPSSSDIVADNIVAASSDDERLLANPTFFSEGSNIIASKGQEKMPDEALVLPPPPKQRKTTFKANNQYIYTHARVPTAHAVFPPGFDARLTEPSVGVKTENTIYTDKAQKNTQNTDKAQKNTKNTDMTQRLTNKTSEVRVMVVAGMHAKSHSSGSITDTCDKQSEQKQTYNSTLSIGNLNKSNRAEGDVSAKNSSTTLPQYSQSKPVAEEAGNKANTSLRFIPRQTVKKPSQRPPMVNSREDAVAVEIKINAFVLKDVQGPVDVVKNRKNQTPSEVSLNKTMLEIRKKVTSVMKVPQTKN